MGWGVQHQRIRQETGHASGYQPVHTPELLSTVMTLTRKNQRVKWTNKKSIADRQQFFATKSDFQFHLWNEIFVRFLVVCPLCRDALLAYQLKLKKQNTTIVKRSYSYSPSFVTVCEAAVTQKIIKLNNCSYKSIATSVCCSSAEKFLHIFFTRKISEPNAKTFNSNFV